MTEDWIEQRRRTVEARGGIFSTSTPQEVNTASNAAMNFASRSRIRYRDRCRCSSRSKSRLRARCVTHAPVGWAVIPTRCT
jgi:hypothetical protein